TSPARGTATHSTREAFLRAEHCSAAEFLCRSLGLGRLSTLRHQDSKRSVKETLAGVLRPSGKAASAPAASTATSWAAPTCPPARSSDCAGTCLHARARAHAAGAASLAAHACGRGVTIRCGVTSPTCHPRRRRVSSRSRDRHHAPWGG